MYNRALINKLIGLVGFENPANPTYATVDAVNQGSRSDRFYTDSPFCKIEYLADCQDYKDADAVMFNTLLTKLQKTSLKNTLDKVFNNADLLERDLVFPYEQNKVNPETLPAGFVGYRIYKAANKAFQITRVFCEFTNTGTFKLLLLTSNQPAPLKSKDITVDTVGFQVEDLTDWVVDNTVNYEGDYYLGYIKNDLIPYKRDYQRSNSQAYFKHLCVETIAVPDHAGDNLFDLTDIKGISENSGVNPDITVFNDHTDWILRNERLIATAVQMAGQIDILKTIISSGRSNPTERISKSAVDKMIFELEGNPELKIYGLRAQYEREISKLKKSFRQNKGLILHTMT